MMRVTQEALVGVPAIVVDGFVTDGGGGGFPLYARVDVSSIGGTVTVSTSPATGYYSFPAYVSSSYTITVTALIPGYIPQTRSITTGTTDRQENFALLPDNSCGAPGYVATGVSANFSNGIPSNWTVTSATKATEK